MSFSFRKNYTAVAKDIVLSHDPSHLGVVPTRPRLCHRVVPREAAITLFTLQTLLQFIK